MSTSDVLNSIFITLFGAGGLVVTWVAVKTRGPGELKREDADAAAVHSSLTPETQTLVAALVSQIRQVEENMSARLEEQRRDFETKLEGERRVRRAETGELRQQLDQALKENSRLWIYVNDVRARWEHHRAQDFPPPLS